MLRRGPSIDPWGTSCLIWAEVELESWLWPTAFCQKGRTGTRREQSKTFRHAAQDGCIVDSVEGSQCRRHNDVARVRGNMEVNNTEWKGESLGKNRTSYIPVKLDVNGPCTRISHERLQLSANFSKSHKFVWHKDFWGGIPPCAAFYFTSVCLFQSQAHS